MSARRVVAVLGFVAIVVCAACGESENGSGTRTLRPGDPLVYVALGHSMTFSPEDSQIVVYSRMLAEDFGVEVELRQHTAGGQHSGQLLDQIRTSPALRTDLAEADVVTLIVPNGDWSEPMRTAVGADGRDPAACGGPDQQQCLRDAIDAYAANAEAILAELAGLADPREVLIRVMDIYLMYVPDLAAAGDLDTIQPYWEEANRRVAEAAADHGIPTAPVYDAFMGADGARDPVADGLVSSDEVHPTAAGARRLAELVHELGYELAE